MRLPFGSAAVVLFAIVLVLGFAVGVLVPSPPEPAVLASSSPVTAVPVATQSFDDERQVELTPHLSPGPELSLLRTGRVTSATCQAGVPIASGASALSLDNTPVLFLATSLPLWRDLSVGMRGDDVTALQAELKRLGSLPEPTGRFDAATDAAVAGLWTQAGRADPPRGLAQADVVWLPAEQAVPESCPLRLGDIVAGGSGFATTVGRIERVTLPDTVSASADLGPRVATIGDVAGVIDPTGSVASPEFLSALQASPEYSAWAASDRKAGVILPVRLQDPIEATVVPPSSLFAVRDPNACLMSRGNPIPVRILSSSLGKAYVRVTNGASVSVVELDGESAHRSSGRQCG
ncbi:MULTISPECIES: peptidoglycan-binding domain-containing protein [unclassified Leifsonia]|uniref:peptidoglycan-binding domain-containing protein n=1 Tax=unclassified Leifsonia TaxID=2663824 RepID=UPI00147C4082|nr:MULTISPECIES: peptidoglycan-binding domain-containing protein [unclassified Leifsonia]